MLKFKTYAENVRMAGKTRDNPHNRPVQIREVAEAIGVSYEAVRKIWNGKNKLYISPRTNDDLCRFLGLPVNEMWALANAEKFSQKAGYVPMQLVEDREGRELTGIWSTLDEEQRQILLRTARSFQREHEHEHEHEQHPN